MYGEEIEILKIEKEQSLFILKCLLFELDYSVNYIEGDFIVTILDNNIKCKNMSFNLTLDDLFQFYKELKKCHNILEGKAILKDSYKTNKIEIEFLKYGQVKINGFIKGEFSSYGIVVNFIIELSYLGEWLKNIETIFVFLKEQGAIYV